MKRMKFNIVDKPTFSDKRVVIMFRKWDEILYEWANKFNRLFEKEVI